MASGTPDEFDLRELALGAAQAGAKVITSATAVTSRYKTSFRDIVTDVDTDSEAAIAEFLRSRRPDDGLLGEESGEHIGTSGVRWIVDPLDGTANFVRRRADYAVAVAAEVSGDVVAGAIVKPATGEWLAGGETGIHGDSAAPSVAATASLERALISVSVSADAREQPATVRLLNAVIPRVQDFRRTGSTSCDLFAVATGTLDAYLGLFTLPWDQAAGWALVEAAGGRCLEFPFGHTQAFIAGAPAVVERLASLLDSQQTPEPSGSTRR